MKTLTSFIALLFVSLIALSQVQESQSLVKIETRDGNEFVGTIVLEDSEKVIIKTDLLGELTINRTAILRITEIDSSKIVGGELWDDNPQSSRYLWTPNGYGLKEGEGYYQNIWVLYNQVSYGFTNHFSMSAGIIPVFLFGAETLGPVWIVPKFSIPLQKDAVNMSLGAFVGAIPGELDGGFGIVFSTLTLGDRNKNVNFGLGWGYAGSDWADRPIINFSGISRISARGYLMTENYYLSSYGESILILSGGYRYMAKQVGIDFGLYIPLASDMDMFIAFPLVGVTIPFNK